MPDRDTIVVAAAIIRDGRVLAARRTTPATARGGWELPGGKVEPGESPAEALVREIREELGCGVHVDGCLDGQQAIRPGLVLEVLTAAMTEGEPVPHEHDAIWWLAADELSRVDWLPADRPFLPELARRLRGARGPR